MLAHPEREPRSVGTGDDVARARSRWKLDLLPAPVTLYYDHYNSQEPYPSDALAQPEQSLEFPAIEADHHLTINDGDWGCPIAEPQQFIKSRSVFLDVLIHKGDTLLRKKLFLLVTCPSARLTVHGDISCH